MSRELINLSKYDGTSKFFADKNKTLGLNLFFVLLQKITQGSQPL